MPRMSFLTISHFLFFGNMYLFVVIVNIPKKVIIFIFIILGTCLYIIYFQKAGVKR